MSQQYAWFTCACSAPRDSNSISQNTSITFEWNESKVDSLSSRDNIITPEVDNSNKGYGDGEINLSVANPEEHPLPAWSGSGGVSLESPPGEFELDISLDSWSDFEFAAEVTGEDSIMDVIPTSPAVSDVLPESA